MNLAMLMLATALQLPIPIRWQFDGPTLSNKTYIADLDYLKANTDIDVINVAPVQGTTPEENRLFHDALKELVEHAGKTAFLVTVQYFNAPDLFGGAMFHAHKRLMDELSDIPLDGFCMDEQGGMCFAFSPNGGDWRAKDVGNKYDAFRFRYYTAAMARHFRERLGLDLKRLLFDMRYAPEGKDAVRIRAINRFWREVQAQPPLVENQVAAYQKKLFGPNVFLSCLSEAIATGGRTAFDFTLGGRCFRGEHTGVLLWRDGRVAYATPDWKMERL